ncbi:hypothetical protein BDN72DRAFT_880165 [Pluteus cervinus]|uniref:Uncharacterized protein n=1 Tax=Pluteus cervinus TaxID=181527 RepID=A0ACD3ALY1_9AGAR|nr:hypothetical protein BDN72DRAFT_880165 [Pluteus cervinus]
MSSATPAAAVPRKIIVDDSDPGSNITYSAGWEETDDSEVKIVIYGPAYRKTLHQTVGGGSFSLSFSFSGTQVETFGTTIGTPIGSDQDPTWTCAIDQNQVGSNGPTGNQDLTNSWPICSASNLADGPHSFVINVASLSLPFRLDYFTYVPSPSVSLANKTITVDSTDSGVTYSDGWSDLKGIANMTQTAGATASFDFFGTALTWFGHIPSEFAHAPTTATYTIDGGSPTTFTLFGLNGTNPQSEFNQAFFTTPNLTLDNHRLEVTHEGNNATTPLSLDFIYVFNGTSSSNTPPPQISSSSSPSSSSPSLTSSSPGQSQSANVNENHSKAPVGAIIGGVVGGLVLLLLLSGFLLRWVRRQRKKASDSDSVLGSEFAANPFNVDTSGGTNSSPQMSSLVGQANVSSRPAVTTQATPSGSSGNLPRGGDPRYRSKATLRDQQEAPPQNTTAVQSEVVLGHQDSGMRIRLVEEPPTYTPN